MRQLVTAFLLTSVASAPAAAASDPGLSLLSQSTRATTRSMAVHGNITLRFGREDAVRPSDRLTLGIAAGPMLSTVDHRAGGVKRSMASATGFTLKPGYSATFSVAGQPLFKSYTRLGAAEADRDDPSSGKGTGKKVATGAAIAGGVALLALIVYFAIPRYGDRT